MIIQFYFDPDLNDIHIHKHDVHEKEIVEFFNEISYYERRRDDGSFEAIGKLKSARFLRVAYRRKEKNTLFVITAYDITDKETIQLLEEKYESY